MTTKRAPKHEPTPTEQVVARLLVLLNDHDATVALRAADLLASLRAAGAIP